MSNVYTWGQIRLLLQQFAGPGTSLDVIDNAIRARYSLILTMMNWSGLDVPAVLETTAAYTAGTISVTQGSTAVTGTGTNWTAVYSGRQLFLGSGAIYTVTIVNPTTLTLDRPFEGSTVSATGYWIARTIYQLPDACRFLRTISSPVNGLALNLMDPDLFDNLEGSHLAIDGPSTTYIPQPDGIDNQTGATVKQIMLWPVPTLAQGYPLRYDQTGVSFDGSTTTDGPLAFVSPYAIIEGCKSDLSRDASESQRWQAMFMAHFTGMVHVENGQRPDQRMRLDDHYTAHRMQRFLRSGGPVITNNNWLLGGSGDNLTGSGTQTVQAFTGTGSQSVFVLPNTPLGAPVVVVGGSLQTITTNYMRAGPVISFVAGSIPAHGAGIQIFYSY